MFKRHAESYGYGVRTWKQHRKTVFGHTGGIDGFVSSLMGTRSTKLTVVVLSNYLRPIFSGGELLNILLGQKVSLPKNPKRQKLSREMKQILPGRYNNGCRVRIEGEKVAITRRHHNTGIPSTKRWYLTANRTLQNCENSLEVPLQIDRENEVVRIGNLEKISKTDWQNEDDDPADSCVKERHSHLDGGRGDNRWVITIKNHDGRGSRKETEMGRARPNSIFLS